MRRHFSSIFCLLIAGLGATSVSGSAILTVVSGSLTLSRFIAPGGEQDDVRGNVTLDVNNGSDLGNIAIFDSTGGTDPNFGTLAFGNNILYGEDLSTQVTQLLFDFGQNVVGSTTVAAFAVNSPFNPATTTDPALSAALGGLELDFALSSLVGPDANRDFLASYTLTGVSAQIPEPASFALVGSSMVLVGAIGLRRKLRTARTLGE